MQFVFPCSELYDPLAQGIHEELDVRAPKKFAVPAGHNVHLMAPEEEYEPGRQGEHESGTLAPNPLAQKPALQGRHLGGDACT